VIGIRGQPKINSNPKSVMGYFYTCAADFVGAAMYADFHKLFSVDSAIGI